MRASDIHPFVPKSTQKLLPGDFWAIPLRNGGFACGRVVELLPKGSLGARVSFLGGLLNWEGASEPTYESIAGAKFIAQGVMHILSIKTTGGSILGNRELEIDSLGAWTFIDGDRIQRGFGFLRPWRLEDNNALHTLSWWGYDVIQVRANQYFVDHSEKDRHLIWWLHPGRHGLAKQKKETP